MATPKYQPIITGDQDAKTASKRRIIYLRPFLLFYLNSLLAEIIFLAIGVFIMSGFDDLYGKVMWTLVFCPLGLGGAMDGLLNCVVVDNLYGMKAVHFTAILALLVLSRCNYLCYNLDRQFFHWFGAAEHPLWFHWRYPMIWLVGYKNGWLMFTDEGQETLAKLGL
jgi:hypothetical protein